MPCMGFCPDVVKRRWTGAKAVKLKSRFCGSPREFGPQQKLSSKDELTASYTIEAKVRVA